ncbi:mycothiol transferase [Blastococcus mobilis]|uniref:Mini-circle protein n=1 Tax=Blastococcus mobilis TaxID=1938746 RepID=A0A238W3N0_9ACTN|nr:DUF664 domain-containing protein [Blastococcus mobilis]SNR40773.1 Protein of unknown function [Blastococcus mobilis]
MISSDPPWEPPLAGTEAEHLVGSLERLRATFRWKADGLDSAGLQTRIGASSLTLGGLLKHLASVGDDVFTRRLSGRRIGGPWESEWAGDGDWAFTSAADDTPSGSTRSGRTPSNGPARGSRRPLTEGGLGQWVHVSTPDGRHASLRRLLCDLIEEYGRHAGHADLLREAVDGLVGEDPPADWRASTGWSSWSS